MTMRTETDIIKRVAGHLSVELNPESDGFYWIWFDQHGSGATVADNIGEKELADLFAAAPELLSALDQMLAEHDAIPGTNPCEITWDDARRAIAKARKNSQTI